jgi:hypothetical protein
MDGAYLGWFDDTKGKPMSEKIADAAERYRQKIGQEPTVALVNTGSVIEYEGLEVRGVDYVRPNNVWVGGE